MGVWSWITEHHPQARMNRVIYDFQQDPSGLGGFKSLGHESMGFASDAVTVGLAVYTRGASLASQKTQVNLVLGQGIFYDPGKVDVTSYGVTGYYLKQLQENAKSPGQDATSPVISGGQGPKKPGGTISSRGAKSPQTLKPFWSNGKPKCRKGYRYDFKRKMCVKKS